jgi:hypothetical protein
MRQWLVWVAAWLAVACSTPRAVSTVDSGVGTPEEAAVLEVGRPPPRLPGPGRSVRGGRGRARSPGPVFNAEPTPEQREAARRRAESAALEQVQRDRYWRLKAEAEQRYPDKRGKYEEHHFFPVYLGGKENGPTYRLPAAYHQLLTNAFRQHWSYGRDKPPPEKAQELMLKVYSDYPIPQLIGIPNP